MMGISNLHLLNFPVKRLTMGPFGINLVKINKRFPHPFILLLFHLQDPHNLSTNFLTMQESMDED